MKTHRAARLLHQLARLLEAGPDLEMDGLDKLGLFPPADNSTAKVAVNLNTLAELSRLDKAYWAAFIRDADLPIPIRPRDASRDILGKLLTYLEANPEAREKLRQRASRQAQASPELMKAFEVLLRDTP